MYVEMVSGGQPFTAGRVCFFRNVSFAPWVFWNNKVGSWIAAGYGEFHVHGQCVVLLHNGAGLVFS